MQRLNAVIAMVALILVSSEIGCSSGLSEAKLAYKGGLDASSQGLITEAISHFDKAIQLDPEHAIAYFNRGWAYHELGQASKVQEDWDKARSLGIE